MKKKELSKTASLLFGLLLFFLIGFYWVCLPSEASYSWLAFGFRAVLAGAIGTYFLVFGLTGKNIFKANRK